MSSLPSLIPAPPASSVPTRRVSSHIEADITAPAEIAFSVAVALGPVVEYERLVITLDGQPLEVDEVAGDDGTRLHVVRGIPVGALVLDYAATVSGEATPPPATELDRIVFLRPSRYCDSDTLAGTAHAEFDSLEGADLVNAVTQWVADNLTYVSGSSRPIDGATDTLLARAGVCRDYAHLVTAFLRAREIPARLVSVYAPGLYPMDFHAVAEAYIDGSWQVLDATRLAPRQSMVRIATGRDAADTAFMSTLSGGVTLTGMTVTAVVDPALPYDDQSEAVELP